jgi:hypothetical protein
MAYKDKSGKAREVKLIASDDEKPDISGKREGEFEVISVPVVEPNLQRSSRIGARLCGGTSTCVAIVELGDENA